MRNLTFINLIITSILILASCSTSNNVVSNKLISKRKYTKGFHLKKKITNKISIDAVAEREEIDYPNHVLASSDFEIKEIVNDVQISLLDFNMVQETIVANEICVKSIDEISTDENQFSNQDLGNKLTKTIENEELSNKFKKAASSNKIDLIDILIITSIVVLLIILGIYLSASFLILSLIILPIVLIWLLIVT